MGFLSSPENILMTFIAIDQRSNLENGLYTGEETCAMLDENDGICGLGHVGVEMELDPEALSTDVTAQEEEGQLEASHSFRRSDCVRTAVPDRRRSAKAALVAATTYETDRSGVTKKLNCKIQTLKHILRRKATSRIKRMVIQGTSLLSLNENTIESANTHHHNHNKSDPTDNSTCCEMTQASLNSASVSNDSSIMAPSSMTTSTCDFAPDPNLHAVFESYLATNPWDAAKKGDFATLTYIANHDDVHIWTQKDVFGHVPLYYACVSYAQGHGQSFGKYGLESVKLLTRIWPEGTEFPRPLLELLRSEQHRIHKDVIEVLSRSSNMNTVVLPLPKEDVRIEGTHMVRPVAFLEDLGDDGFDEDY